MASTRTPDGPPSSAPSSPPTDDGVLVAPECANCGARLPTGPPARWCPQCGQEARLLPPRAREFLHEFIGHYFSLEGALWRTLRLLVFRPGELTREYLAGRRRRYVLPLRLFISTSFLFFILVKVLGVGLGPFIDIGVELGSAEERESVTACAEGLECAGVERWMAQRIIRLDSDGVDNARMAGEMLSSAPLAMFLLQPVVAAWIALAYRRRSQPYGVHFVFSLHLHSFGFLVMLAIALLPSGPGSLLLAPLVAYMGIAMHRVFGGRVWATLLRLAGLALAYVATMIAALAVMAAVNLALL